MLRGGGHEAEVTHFFHPQQFGFRRLFNTPSSARMLPIAPDACAALVAATFVGLAVVRRCCAVVIVDVPVLSHCNGFVGSNLLPRLSTLRQGYRPPLLHPTGLLQSRLADLRPPPAEATPFVRETLLLPALSPTPSSTPWMTACCPELVPAGLVSIDWLDQPDATAPICLLIPGLTGSSDSAYIRRTAVALHAAGVRVGCFNPRGSMVRSRHPAYGSGTLPVAHGRPLSSSAELLPLGFRSATQEPLLGAARSALLAAFDRPGEAGAATRSSRPSCTARATPRICGAPSRTSACPARRRARSPPRATR